jgi:hypothetical protein
MQDKIILDLCGGTGSWSKPYKDAGYDVRLVTLPDSDVRNYEPPANVHGILAAPPCTMFSLARRTAKTPPDFDGAMEVVGACLKIIWKCRAEGSLQWWVLENPRGLLRQFIGKPGYTFTPWWFGDESKKHTDLWGYFQEPRKLKDAVMPDYNRKVWGTAKHPFAVSTQTLTRTEIRAITPAGFAKAFMRANP